MNREVSEIPDRHPEAAGDPANSLLSLLLSSPEQPWLFPDDPFLNAGCQILRGNDLDQAESLFRAHQPLLVFAPLVLGTEPCLPCVKACLEHNPNTTIVVVANNSQINDAAEAMRNGAFDCLFTPFSHTRLTKTVAAAVQRAGEVNPHLRLHTTAVPADDAPSDSVSCPPDRAGVASQPANAPSLQSMARQLGLLGSGTRMQALLEDAAAVSQSQAPIFLQGENGTGKEHLARAIHASSPWRDTPFVALDCAAMTPEGLERMLLGMPLDHGPGGTEQAIRRGTLFLDEITNLALSVQPRLVRLLHNGEWHPPGTGEVVRLDLRIISATDRNPTAEIRRGTLREDLFFRLHVAPLTLPPLRDRGGDIVEIAQARLRQLAANEGRSFRALSDCAAQALMAYHWPGNMRQLHNVLWHVVLTHDGPLLKAEMLPEEIQFGTAPRMEGADTTASVEIAGRTLAEIERDVIERVVREHDGSIPRAARALDVSPSTLYRKRDAWTRDEDT